MLLLAALCLMVVVSPVSAEVDLQGGAARYNPADVLRAARTIYIRTNTVFFKPATLENGLLRRDEFQQWGLSITREEAEADLIIEVDRKLFTSAFVFSVIDPHAKKVVASGKVNSLGGTVEGKITDSFIKRMRQVRASAPPGQSK
jgi:hypothetical protein